MLSTTSVDCLMFIALLLLPMTAHGVLTSAERLLGDTSYPGALGSPVESPYWEFILREFIFKTISPPPPGNNNLYKRLLEAPFYRGPFPVVSLDGKDAVLLLSRGNVYRLPNGGWIMCQEGCTACKVCQELKDLIRPTVKWVMRRVKRLVPFARSRYDLQLTVSPQDDDSFHMRNLSPSSYVYVTANSGVLDSLSKVLISQDKGNLDPRYPFGTTKLPRKVTQSKSSLGEYKPVSSTENVDNGTKKVDIFIATKSTISTLAPEIRTSTWLPTNQMITTSGIPDTTNHESTSPLGKNGPVTTEMVENTTKKVDKEVSISLQLTTSTLAPETQTTMWLQTTTKTAPNGTFDNVIGSTSSTGKNSSIIEEVMENMTKKVDEELSTTLQLTTSTLAPETRTSTWLPATNRKITASGVPDTTESTSPLGKNSTELMENVTKKVESEVSIASQLTTSTLIRDTETKMRISINRKRGREILSERRDLQRKSDHSGEEKWTTKNPQSTEGSLVLFHPSRVRKVETIDAGDQRVKDSRLILGMDQFGEKHLVHIVPAGDLDADNKTPSLDTKTELFYRQPQSHLVNASEFIKDVPKSEDRPLYRKIFRRVMDSLNANKIVIEKFLFSSKQDRHPGHLSKDEGEPAPVTSNYSRNILGSDIDLDNPKSITHPLENGDAVPRDVFEAPHSILRDASSSNYNSATSRLKQSLTIGRERTKSKTSLTLRPQPERKPASKRVFENRITENVTTRIADNSNGTKSSTVFNGSLFASHNPDKDIEHTMNTSTSISTVTVDGNQDEKPNDHRFREPDVIAGEEDPSASAKQRNSSDSLILKEVARSVVNHASTLQGFAAINNTRPKITEAREHAIDVREKDHSHT